MARFARIDPEIWSNTDFTALEPPAQHLYMVLLSQPSMSWAGIADWRPKRLSRLAQGWTEQDVIDAANVLAANLFIVIDDDTEEVLIRTFHKGDKTLGSPNMGAAVAKAYRSATSATLKGVIIHELRRLHDEQPTLPGWKTIGNLLEKYEPIDPTTLTRELASAPF